MKESLKDDVDTLTAEDILNLDDDQNLNQDEESNDIEVVEEIKEFTLKDVSNIIEKLSEVCDLATECDPNLYE